jgi:LysR family transcriptional regulator, hydrogen peroxide-inducible genes activator
MNLQQFEYIVAVDKYKSFSKAAESCYVTQATLSVMVKKLEGELGLVLFDRKTNPIITTECGKEIIGEAHKILFHSHNVKQLASLLKGKIEGELRIGVIPTIAGNLLHRVIPSFIGKYPGLELFIAEITTANIINQLKTGELDVGIVSTPLGKEEIEEDILYYEKLKVYGAPSGDKKFLIPEEISEENIWLLEEGNCIRDQAVNLCSINPGKIKSNLHFQPNSFECLLNFVDEFSGLTLIPELYCMDLPAEKKGKVTDFKTPFPVREVSMVYYRPYAKQRLVNALSEEIKRIIPPLLETSRLKNSEMRIVRP